MNLIGKKNWFFLFSGLIILPGMISLFFYGLRLSIDFTGGTLVELKIPFDSAQGGQAKFKIEEIKMIFQKEGVEVSQAQTLPDNGYIFRTREISAGQNQKILAEARQKYPNLEETRFEAVGPIVSRELAQKAVFSVIAASLMIIVYIAFSFRNIPPPVSPWRFGMATVLALIHDILVVLGLFSLLGHFYQVEIDTLFVTAMLTVIGFSVHDTIVVFDRIRENLRRKNAADFAQTVNISILQTLNRSLTTSLTVIMTLFSLLLFSEGSTRWFVVALLAGIISGTYSSIFNAAPLLVVWQEFKR